MTTFARARGEIALLALLLLADAMFYFVVIPAGIADPDDFGLDQGLPPSFSARVAAILMAVIMAIRLVHLLVAPEVAQAGDEASNSQESENAIRNIGGIAGALAFAFGLVPVLGYYLGGVCMVATLVAVMGERRWSYLLWQPAAVMGFIWLLFDQVFSIELPVGLLFGS